MLIPRIPDRRGLNKAFNSFLINSVGKSTLDGISSLAHRVGKDKVTAVYMPICSGEPIERVDGSSPRAVTRAHGKDFWVLELERRSITKGPMTSPDRPTHDHWPLREAGKLLS